MENASKALLMAAGILVGILILALMVTLFISSRDVTITYEAAKQTEEIEQFNVNFTKYLGQDLTIHQVVTIYNFAIENNVAVNGEEKTLENIKSDVDNYTNAEESIQKYILTINSYSAAGYVKSISFK